MLYPAENKVREVKDLSGIWRFKVDRQNAGLQEKWFERPLQDTVPMAVPASFNDLMNESADREHVGYVWYETVFSVPASWEGRRIVLRFGSAAHHAVVWLDGREIMRHKGGFLPFEAEVSAFVTGVNEKEEHRLTVALSNMLDWTCLPCGEIITKEGPGYPEGYRIQETYFDFYNYAGIHRPVKLYTTPVHFIEDIVIRTKLSGDLTEAEISCDIFGSDPIRSVRILREDGRVALELDGAGIPDADGRKNFSVIQKNPVPWEPGAAYLYRLRVEGLTDLYTESFGIRSIEIGEKSFLINGKPFYFKGFGKHEDSDIRGKGLDNALNVKDFALLKWIGANSFRTSHYPYSEELMNLADREGFVLIDEVPAVGMCFFDRSARVFDGSRVNGETLAHHKDTLRELYARDKNHPCVVMWSVGNEADTSEAGSVPYFREVIEEMRSLDSTRPVTLVQTRGPQEDLVSQWLDVICINRYYAWYTDHGHPEVIGLQCEAELKDWFDKYRKPVIVTEYGADTVSGLHKFPPVAFSEEYQCEFLNEYHKVFDRVDFVVGEQVWAFADFMTKQGVNRIDGNKKGVFTRNRQPKMAAYLLKKRWESKRPSKT